MEAIKTAIPRSRRPNQHNHAAIARLYDLKAA